MTVFETAALVGWLVAIFNCFISAQQWSRIRDLEREVARLKPKTSDIFGDEE